MLDKFKTALDTLKPFLDTAKTAIDTANTAKDALTSPMVEPIVQEFVKYVYSGEAEKTGKKIEEECKKLWSSNFPGSPRLDMLN